MSGSQADGGWRSVPALVKAVMAGDITDAEAQAALTGVAQMGMRIIEGATCDGCGEIDEVTSNGYVQQIENWRAAKRAATVQRMQVPPRPFLTEPLGARPVRMCPGCLVRLHLMMQQTVAPTA